MYLDIFQGILHMNLSVKLNKFNNIYIFIVKGTIHRVCIYNLAK